MQKVILFLVYSIAVNLLIISNANAQLNYLTMKDDVFISQLKEKNISSIMESLDEEWAKTENIRYFDRIKQIEKFIVSKETAFTDEERSSVLYAVISTAIKKRLMTIKPL